MTQLIHDWKRNGWKNAKKGHVANAMLWGELDTGVTREAKVEFTLVKAHSEILRNECADKPGTREVLGNSYGQELVVRPDEQEDIANYGFSEGELADVEDMDLGGIMGSRRNWEEMDRPPSGAIHVESVGLAVDEQQKHQEDQQMRCLPSRTSRNLGHIMVHPYSPRRSATLDMIAPEDSASKADDSGDGTPVEDSDDSGVVQCVSGHGFQVCEAEQEQEQERE
jgi:hypothetical protein